MISAFLLLSAMLYCFHGSCRWGDHVELKKFQLKESWGNAQFQKDRDSTRFKGCRPEHSVSENCSFQFLEGTWWEQRKFSTEVAADTLSAAAHPLWTKYLKDELASIDSPVVTPEPAKQGFSPFTPTGKTITIGKTVSLNFDADTGAISQLDVGATSWASTTNALLEVEYQTYNISQFQAFQRAYSNLTQPPGYFPHDFGKPNDTQAVAHVQTAAARSFWKRNDAGGNITSFLVELGFTEASLSQEYGAPTSIWIRLDIVPMGSYHDGLSVNNTNNSTASISVSVDLIGKVATRHAEATFLRFMPQNM
eukprot:SAG31_NODE_2925_length_4905_cov_2.222222_3_plen_308_part_00